MHLFYLNALLVFQLHVQFLCEQYAKITPTLPFPIICRFCYIPSNIFLLPSFSMPRTALLSSFRTCLHRLQRSCVSRVPSRPLPVRLLWVLFASFCIPCPLPVRSTRVVGFSLHVRFRLLCSALIISVMSKLLGRKLRVHQTATVIPNLLKSRASGKVV